MKRTLKIIFLGFFVLNKIFSQNYLEDIKKVNEIIESSRGFKFKLIQTIQYNDTDNNLDNDIFYMFKNGNIAFKTKDFEGVKNENYSIIIHHKLKHCIIVKNKKKKSFLEDIGMSDSYKNQINDLNFFIDYKKKIKTYNYYNEKLQVKFKVSFDINYNFIDNYEIVNQNSSDGPKYLAFRIRDFMFDDNLKNENFTYSKYGKFEKGVFVVNDKYKNYQVIQ